MTTATATPSFDYARKRKQFIDDALNFVQKTRQLEETYDRQEEHRTQRLDDIEQALQETDLRIVVVGEFSRGKSMLLNALVGEEILPTNDMQTTAINTFIYGVDPGEEPHLEIVKRNGETERLPWEEHVIEKWGTELDREHRDARREVDRILAYSDHPLLQNDLVLIDTPGFQGLLDYHEDIARDAMNEAHVAIWLQATDQLGGNAREWEFVRETISQNFEKFITVINKWDRVLEPASARERETPLEVRERRAIEEVRKHFHQQCDDVLSDEALEMLTSDKNLLGVSAQWGVSDELEKRKRSNIQNLEERIEEMCKSTESTQQILAGPLRSMATIQEQLLSTIEQEIAQLEKADELEDLESEIQQLDNKIEALELEFERKLEDIKTEHNTYARRFQEDIESELIRPLEGLADEIDLFLDKKKIRRQLKNDADTVGLPEEVREKFKNKTEEINAEWRQIREQIEQTLQDLASSFEEDISGFIEDFDDSASIELGDLSDLDFHHTVDLGAFEEYQQKQAELSMKRQQYEEELHDLETSSVEANLEVIERKSERKKQQLDRLERKRANMGPPPPPRERTEVEYQWRGGLLGKIGTLFIGKKKVEKTVEDDSPVKEHKKRKAELDQMISNKQEAIEDLIDEYQEKHQVKLSRQQAERKYKRKLKKLEKKHKEFEEKKTQALEDATERTYNRLRRSTIGSINQMRESLNEQFSDSIQQLFDQHCDQLRSAVEEQYLEPLSTRRDMRSDKMDLMQKKETELEDRQQELDSLKARLEDLIENTSVLQTEIRKLHAE